MASTAGGSRPCGPQRRRLVAQDRGDRAEIRAAGERPPPGEHLVEHGAEREDVGPRDPPAGLPPVPATCRRPCPMIMPGARRERRHRRVGRRALDQLREAEVEHLHAAVAGDHDVGRLDVAVDDAARVRGARARRRFCTRNSSAFAHRQRPVREQPVERRAIHQLHRDERDAVVFVDLVDRDDVGMVERGGGTAPPARTGVAVRRRPSRRAAAS